MQFEPSTTVFELRNLTPGGSRDSSSFTTSSIKKDMGVSEVNAFLNHLAVDRNVSASTQNQALCAIVFLYNQISNRDQNKMRRLEIKTVTLRLGINRLQSLN